ncbi:MAG: helix-turn-helix domain-containing protein, partial [Bacteroidota bacterium]
LQGIFLVFVLYRKRQAYKKPTLWFFIGCLISVMLFAIGDDEYNLIASDTSWFLFHEPLMITFFSLFIRYRQSEESAFKKIDALFFLPYCFFIIFEPLTDYFTENQIVNILGSLIELSFLGMLLYSIYDILKNQKEKWLLIFILPFTLVFFIDEVAKLTIHYQGSFFHLDSFGIFLTSTLLFYFVSYRLIITPKDILPSTHNKYKSSRLSKSKVDSLKKELARLMTEEKLFKNQKLNSDEVAERLGIKKQQLSEVLNVHMGLRFQDLLNQYRVEEFINCLHHEDYKNYKLFGIATEVGFSSKSSFNSTFKKLKGLTPSQYRKQNLA